MATMKSSNPMPADNWQTESDVRTLAEAEKIKGDKKRHGRAKAKARQMANELQRVHQAPSAGKTPSDNDGDE